MKQGVNLAIDTETNDIKDIHNAGPNLTQKQLLETVEKISAGGSINSELLCVVSHEEREKKREKDSEALQEALFPSTYHTACITVIKQKIEGFEAEIGILQQQKEQQQRDLDTKIAEMDDVFNAPAEASGLDDLISKTGNFTDSLGADSFSTSIVYKTGPDGQVTFYQFDPTDIMPNLVPVDDKMAQKIKDLYGDDAAAHAVSYDEYKDAQIKATEYGNTEDDPFAQDEKEEKLSTEVTAKEDALTINKNKIQALSEKTEHYKDVLKNGTPEDVAKLIKEEGLEHKVQSTMNQPSLIAAENPIQAKNIKGTFNALTRPEADSPATPHLATAQQVAEENTFNPAVIPGLN